MIQCAQSWIRLPSPLAHPTAAPHTDPLHVAATFLYPASVKHPFDSIKVKALKRGKGVTLVQVDLVQRKYPVLRAHLFLTNFAARRGEDPPIKGPSFPFPACPLTWPKDLPESVERRHYGGKQIKYSRLTTMRRDAAFEEREKGKVAGAWFEIEGEGEVDGLGKGRESGIGYHWLPIWCDIYV